MSARLARLAAAAAALSLSLAGCVLAPSQMRDAPNLAGIPESFELAGRMAVRQGDRSDIAKLRWTHRGQSDTWVISTPLGNEVARIDSDPSGAVLLQGPEPQRAPSFAVLTESLLGIALEPAQLARWLHGTEEPSLSSGWTVVLEDRQPAGALTIAKRMSASRGDVSIRLVVDEYRIGEDEKRKAP